MHRFNIHLVLVLSISAVSTGCDPDDPHAVPDSDTASTRSRRAIRTLEFSDTDGLTRAEFKYDEGELKGVDYFLNGRLVAEHQVEYNSAQRVSEIDGRLFSDDTDSLELAYRFKYRNGNLTLQSTQLSWDDSTFFSEVDYDYDDKQLDRIRESFEILDFRTTIDRELRYDSDGRIQTTELRSTDDFSSSSSTHRFSYDENERLEAIDLEYEGGFSRIEVEYDTTDRVERVVTRETTYNIDYTESGFIEEIYDTRDRIEVRVEYEDFDVVGFAFAPISLLPDELAFHMDMRGRTFGSYDATSNSVSAALFE